MPKVCAKPKILWTRNSVIHVLTDFAIVILLTPLLKHLNIPRKQKTALVLVFAIGFSTSITSIMRFNSLVRISSSLLETRPRQRGAPARPTSVSLAPASQHCILSSPACCPHS
jgi:hypothetical protein